MYCVERQQRNKNRNDSVLFLSISFEFSSFEFLFRIARFEHLFFIPFLSVLTDRIQFNLLIYRTRFSVFSQTITVFDCQHTLKRIKSNTYWKYSVRRRTNERTNEDGKTQASSLYGIIVNLITCLPSLLFSSRCCSNCLLFSANSLYFYNSTLLLKIISMRYINLVDVLMALFTIMPF